MASKKESRLEWFYRVVIPKATSLGAAIVVFGAMFKINHYPGAGLMLVVGLSTETLIFLLGLFEPSAPPDPHYDWSLAYPELVGKGTNGNKKALPEPADPKITARLAEIDKMIANSNLSSDSFKSFGKGMQTLNDTAGKMKDITNAASASNNYTKSLESATKTVNDLNKAYAGTVSAVSQMANTQKEAKEYHGQIQAITKNLGALNAVYEMELRDANSHLKAMNKFYSNLTVAMESMSDASKESQVFKEQIKGLTTNLTALNNVYGKMLTAMKG